MILLVLEILIVTIGLRAARTHTSAQPTHSVLKDAGAAATTSGALQSGARSRRYETPRPRGSGPRVMG
jgi:hypothetical protein